MRAAQAVGTERSSTMNKNVFWIFGVLQSLSLAAIIYLLFTSLNAIRGSAVIGPDTHILLSVAFPLFLLLVEYVIYTKR
jgi:hypothetical protein